MTYALVIPAQFVRKMYLLREAGFIKSIRAFILVAVQDHVDLYAKELKEIEKNNNSKQT